MLLGNIIMFVAIMAASVVLPRKKPLEVGLTIYD